MARDLTINASKSFNITKGDDLEYLHKLAGGVGWEFGPDQTTTDKLKELKTRWIRCINVDWIPGKFDEEGNYNIPAGAAGRLDQNLATCKSVGANPHVVIGLWVPDELKASPDVVKQKAAIMGATPGNFSYWNGDWNRMRSFWKSIFRYVILDKGFSSARFEVGNEPDGAGGFPRLVGQEGTPGSRASYNSYMDIYRNVSQAAQEFETEHPGVKVQLGGPALAWAFTFKYGELNWADQFIQDCSKKRLKVDFIGIHFYGNIASLHGEYPTNFPSFSDMWHQTSASRDRDLPGVPICFTEWGPSYVCSNDADSLVNANPMGAAWCAEFLNTMLEVGADSSIFLVTTDLTSPGPDGNPKVIWGWPSFFTHFTAFGHSWPKAPLHTFEMMSQLQGQRLDLTGVRGDSIHGFAAGSKETKVISAVLWNYKANIKELEEAVELSRDEKISVYVNDTAAVLGEAKLLRVRQWRVSKSESNALNLFQNGGNVDERANLQLVSDTTIDPNDLDTQGTTVSLPASSVLLLKIEPVK